MFISGAINICKSITDQIWRDRDTRFDLAKSGIIGLILVRRAYGRPLKFFKVLLYMFNYFFKKFSDTCKNHAYCKCELDCFCELTIRQPILLYPPAYCGLETFCRHPMTLGALLSNRIMLGDWQVLNLFDFVNLLQPRYCTIRHPVLNGVFQL